MQQYLAIFNVVILVVGAVVLGVTTFWNTRRIGTRQTIEDYEAALKGRDLKIQMMEKDMADMKSRINHLESVNNALQSTIKNYDILIEIQKTLAPVPALFQPGGILETSIKNDQAMMAEMTEIKKLLAKPHHHILPT